MKYRYTRYKRNGLWQCPKEKQIWCRERDRRGQVLISMCNMGGYVLNLSLFCTFACDFDEALKMKNPPIMWEYEFTLYTNPTAEIIYCCNLSNNMWFDTIDINVAEKTAEYIWNKTLFNN